MSDTLQSETDQSSSSAKKRIVAGAAAVAITAGGAIGYHAATSQKPEKPHTLNYTAHNREVFSNADASLGAEIKTGETRLILDGGISIDAEHATAFDPVTKEPMDLRQAGATLDQTGRVNIVDGLLIEDAVDHNYYVYFTDNNGKASQVRLNNAVYTNSNAAFETGDPQTTPTARLDAVIITGNSPTGSFIAANHDGINQNIAAVVTPPPGI
jgi:hypothetical protein